MKKILLTALVLAGFTATAQVKVGSNPTSLATDAKFQVEGSTGAQTVILDNGNVGIGTTTPTSKLHVYGGDGMIEEGNFAIKKATGNSFISNVGGTNAGADYGSFQIISNDYSASNNRMIMSKFYGGYTGMPDGFQIVNHVDGTPVGNLIIKGNGDFEVTSGWENNIAKNAKLAVDGYVKLGSTDTSADATPSAGLIRYNSGLQYHDGTAWNTVGTTAGASASKWTNDATNTRVALTNLSDGTTARPADKSLFVDDKGSVTINADRSSFVSSSASLGLGVFDNQMDFTTSSATAVSRNGIYEYSPLNIAAGVSLTGVNQFTGARADIVRIGATNAGSFTGSARGMLAVYGHHSSIDAAATSETIIGFHARPYSQKGTITNLYDFYGSNEYEAGGTVTNRYGIGIDGPNKKNYFMGNVGIGNNNPNTKLHITGTGIMTRFSSTSANGNNYFVFDNNGVNTGYMGFGGSADDHMSMYNMTSTGKIFLGTQNSKRLTVDADGKIGIGTDAPSNLLHLNIAGGAATTEGIRFSQPSWTSQHGFVNFSSTNNNLQLGTSGSTFGVSFFTNNTERMRIVGNNGNVGIGTATPAFNLDVTGTARATSKLLVGASALGLSNTMEASNSANGKIAVWRTLNGSNNPFFNVETSADGIELNSDGSVAGAMMFSTGDIERMRVAANGNVGIGTITPTTKLEVAGTIKIGDSNDATPTAGMIRFNAGTSKFQGYDGTAWVDLH